MAFPGIKDEEDRGQCHRILETRGLIPKLGPCVDGPRQGDGQRPGKNQRSL